MGYLQYKMARLKNVLLKEFKIRDLTGAGDLFAAGFLHGYVNKLSLKESLEKGTETILLK